MVYDDDLGISKIGGGDKNLGVLIAQCIWSGM